VDYLDFYFCHRPDKNTPMEETVWAMHQLIMQGKVLYWGTSEWSAQEIMEAIAVARQHNLVAPVMEQPQYSMIHRDRVEVEYHKLYRPEVDSAPPSGRRWLPGCSPASTTTASRRSKHAD
jgi:aryl-alcohol dehydrogenase-like predicted oxidoreductase